MSFFFLDVALRPQKPEGLYFIVRRDREPRTTLSTFAQLLSSEMMSKNIVDLYSNYDCDHHSIVTLVARSLPHQFSRQSHRSRETDFDTKIWTRKWNRLPLLSCSLYFQQVNKQPLGLACGCNKHPTLVWGGGHVRGGEGVVVTGPVIDGSDWTKAVLKEKSSVWPGDFWHHSLPFKARREQWSRWNCDLSSIMPGVCV